MLGVNRPTIGADCSMITLSFHFSFCCFMVEIAKALQSTTPKQVRISAMWDDVIRYGRGFDLALF
jgi:hypothetical protein